MNEVLRKEIISEIKKAGTIVISRHIRPDGDAVGSSKGLASVLKATFPDKKVLVINEDYSLHTAFMGKEDCQIPEEEYSDCLGIVVDTGVINRVSNKLIEKASKIIKIDHHIEEEPFGDIKFVDTSRISCSEMVAELVIESNGELVMTKEAAGLLFAGIVTDSGRFKYAETSSKTLMTAAYLMDFGIDVQEIYDNIYLESFEEFSLKSHFLGMIEFTKSRVAYIYFSLKELENLGITAEIASNSVDLMQEIKGTNIWIVFIEQPDGKIRARLRSRKLDVQALAVKYHGGGHINASGATCYSKEEVKSLLEDADSIHDSFHCLA